MKWWQIGWLAVVMIWGNVLFGILAVNFVAGGHLTHDLPETVTFCLMFFTLPAAGLYLVCAGLSWLVPRAWRRAAARARGMRTHAQPTGGHPVRPASA